MAYRAVPCCVMTEHSNIPLNLQLNYLKLARFVLENNYVECKGVEGSFLQRIGTAMGTSFSVTYAMIFMIWLETSIINEFQQQIVLYRRYIDDIFLIWSQGGLSRRASLPRETRL